MKSKKAIYILLPTVIIIWGIIIFRIVDALRDDAPIAVETERAPTSITDSKEVYTLNLNYPDPFLGKSKVTQTTAKPKPVSKPKAVVSKKKPDEVPTPKLRYNGRIENRTSSAERHLISVNGNTHIVTLGEETDGVRLTKVFTDSVQFTWNGKHIYVRR